jgi:hypothetical protein
MVTMVSESHDGHDVEGAVGGPVSASAQAVSAGGPPAAGWLRCHAAEFGEGGFIVDAFGIVSGGDEELAGQLDTDAEEFDELRCGGANDDLNLFVECFDFAVKGLPPAGQVAKGGLDAGHQQALGVSTQVREVGGFGPKTEAAVDQGPLGERDELVAQRRWGADHDPEQGVESLGSGLDCAAAGDTQSAYHFDHAALGFWCGGRGLAEDGTGDLFGVEAVRLAVHSSGDAVRSVDLDDSFAGGRKGASQGCAE